MKKVVAILLAGALVVGGAVTAFAAPSPSASTTVAESSSTTTSSGKVSLKSYTLEGVSEGADVKLVADESYQSDTDKDAAAAIEASPADTLTTVVGSDKASGMNFLDVFDVRLEGAAKDQVTGAITATLTVKGVTASSNVIVLHYTGGKWIQETATPGDGVVTITFGEGSLSPVAIYVDSTTYAAGNGGSTAGTTSPKTGEAPVAAVATMIALCAVVGMAVSSRRRHA